MSKILPQESRESELGVIGSILKAPESINGIFKFLEESDFYYPDLKALFSICKELYDSKTPIDQLLVHQKAVDKGIAQEIKSPDIIAVAIGFVPNTDNLASYAEVVKEKSARRNLVEACRAVAIDAVDTNKGIDILIDKAKGIVNGIKFIAENKTLSPIAVEADKLIAKLDRLVTTGEREKVLMTGFPRLDYKMDGIKMNELVVFAAPTGQGKSAWGLTMIRNLCGGDAKLSAGIISLEMSNEVFAKRLLSAEALVPLPNFRNPSADDLKRIKEAQSWISTWRFYLDDDKYVTPEQLATKITNLVKYKKVDFVVVDYYQLLAPSNPKIEKLTNLTQASKILADLTLELQCPIICLAQANAKIYEKERQPELDMIYYGNKLGHDASKVCFIKWSSKQNEAGISNTEFHLVKNRTGATGMVEFVFDGPYAVFKEKQ